MFLCLKKETRGSQVTLPLVRCQVNHSFRVAEGILWAIELFVNSSTGVVKNELVRSELNCLVKHEHSVGALAGWWAQITLLRGPNDSSSRAALYKDIPFEKCSLHAIVVLVFER